MPKNSSVNTQTRQWLVLRMIPRRGRIGTREILDRLQSEYSIETNIRTIQRDLQDLSRNFPIISDNKQPAGWCWSEDAKSLDLPAMDPMAALTFRLVQESMTRMLPKGALTSLKSYFRTADDQLKKLPAQNLSHWPDKVRVVSRSLTLEPPVIDETVLERVYEALHHEVCFEAVYQQPAKKEKKYEVNPLGLVFINNLIYLVATLWEYSNPVQLLLHRIKSITLLDRKVVTPEGFSLQGYIDNGEFGYPRSGGMIKLKVLLDMKAANHLYESKLSSDQKLKERPDGKVLLEATVRDDFQLRWWLKGFGEKIEVLEPQSLRDEFFEMAQNLSGIYKSRTYEDTSCQIKPVD